MALAVFFPLNVGAAIVAKVGLGQFLLSHILLLAIALFYGAIGMFCSWACRRTQVSTAVAAGTVAFLTLASPLALTLWQSVSGYSNYANQAINFLPLWTNPYFAMSELVLHNNSQNHPEVALLFTMGALIGTVLLLGIVTRKLAHGPKEMSA